MAKRQVMLDVEAKGLDTRKPHTRLHKGMLAVKTAEAKALDVVDMIPDKFEPKVTPVVKAAVKAKVEKPKRDLLGRGSKK